MSIPCLMIFADGLSGGLSDAKDIGIFGIFVLLVLKEIVPLIKSRDQNRSRFEDNMQGSDRMRVLLAEEADWKLIREMALMLGGMSATQNQLVAAVADIAKLLDRMDKMIEGLPSRDCTRVDCLRRIQQTDAEEEVRGG